jgi:hypothetical protein
VIELVRYAGGERGSCMMRHDANKNDVSINGKASHATKQAEGERERKDKGEGESAFTS